MKDKAYRLAQKERIIKKRLRLIKATESPSLIYPDGKTQYEHAVAESNKVNKRHPFDCGKSDCMLCHRHKIHKKYDSKQNKYKTSPLEDYNEF